ncbi:MAG: hypothetical protein WC551_09330 [Patescibacteria group bacterium]
MEENHVEREEWTGAEQTLRSIAGEVAVARDKSTAVYQWALGIVLALLMFVLGVVCQGERLSSTVVKTEARVSALEADMRDLKEGIAWLRSNAATRDDIKSVAGGGTPGRL